MRLAEGDRLPQARLQKIGAKGVEQVDLEAVLAGRKVVIFGLPGAYTGTCSKAHVPSFIRTKGGFDAKGVDEIICVSVNDAYVMRAWGEVTGATAAGITMLGDPESAFTLAIGMEFSTPDSGFINRSKRYAMYVEDGVVKVLHREKGTGVCDLSGGESMLEAI